MSNSFDDQSATSGTNDPTARQAQHHLDNLLGRIPGYKGYRDKEDRRDADRAIRDQLAGGLDTAAQRVERVARDLANRRQLSKVSMVDEWVQSLRLLANRTRTASYGYGGLFGDRDVDAKALDQLHQFDEALLADLQRLEDPIQALEAAIVADGDLGAAVRAGLDVTRDLASKFHSRGSVVSSGDPEPQQRMRELLESARQVSPSAAWDLDAGDAVSITGDDFLVDARLHVDAGDVSFRLFRLGERSDKRWLFVPRDRSNAPALLRQVDDVPVAGLTADHAGTGQSQLVGPAGASEAQTVQFTLSSSPGQGPTRAVVLEWPNERMSWLGEEIGEEEITIFGSPAGHA